MEVEAAAGPAAVVAVGVTPMPNRGGLFLKLTSTESLLSRTSTTPKKGTPSSQRPRRPSTGSSGTQERNVELVLPVARSLVSVRPTFLTLLLPFPLLCRLFLRFLTQPSALPMKRRPMTTHPTAKPLPWFVRARRPKAKTDPLTIVYLLFELFDWQLTLDIILLTLVLK